MCAVARWYDPNCDPELHVRMPRLGAVPPAEGMSPGVAFVGAKLAPGERLVEPLPRGKFKRQSEGRRAPAPEGEVPYSRGDTTPWRGAAGGVVEIEDHGILERVTIDKVKGPQAMAAQAIWIAWAATRAGATCLPLIRSCMSGRR